MPLVDYLNWCSSVGLMNRYNSGHLGLYNRLVRAGIDLNYITSPPLYQLQTPKSFDIASLLVLVIRLLVLLLLCATALIFAEDPLSIQPKLFYVLLFYFLSVGGALEQTLLCRVHLSLEIQTPTFGRVIFQKHTVVPLSYYTVTSKMSLGSIFPLPKSRSRIRLASY